jgi:hypothetical protein
LFASCSTKLLRRLTSHKKSSQAHSGRQGTKRNLPTSSVDIPEGSCTSAPIVEMNCAETTPDVVRKAP